MQYMETQKQLEKRQIRLARMKHECGELKKQVLEKTTTAKQGLRLFRRLVASRHDEELVPSPIMHRDNTFNSDTKHSRREKRRNGRRSSLAMMYGEVLLGEKFAAGVGAVRDPRDLETALTESGDTVSDEVQAVTEELGKQAMSPVIFPLLHCPFLARRPFL